MSKKAFGRSLALSLFGNGATMTFGGLSQQLYANNYRSGSGKPYDLNGGRGVASFVRSLWRYWSRKGDHVAANAIAKAFTDKYGRYAYLL